MENYNKIKSVMQDMTIFFDGFLVSLQEKLEVITDGNTDKLEELMKHEQAFSMKIRGLEKNREAAIKELGISASEFKKVMENPQEEHEKSAALVYMRLRHQIKEYTSLSDAIKSQIDMKLYGIKIILERLEKAPGQTVYDKNGVDLKTAQEFKSTKI